MKRITIKKNKKIKFQGILNEKELIKVEINFKRYENMINDILKNNFKNKELKEGKTIETDLNGETPLEKLETFFKQFNDLFDCTIEEI